MNDPMNTSLQFRPCAAVSSQPTPWRESNGALSRLLKRIHRELIQARALAVEIRLAIDQLLPEMTALCRLTCRFCPEPCCITNTVWIDFRDLLLLHLLEAPVPTRQAATNPGDACPFLGPRGCRLPWQTRPWMCIKYTCPAQRGVLQKKGRPAWAALYADIEIIEENRIRMEAEVVRRIRQKIRTSPSSSFACSG